LCVLFGCLLAQAGLAQTRPVRAAVCHFTADPIAIDGAADEPQWARAAAVTDFTNFIGVKYAWPQTVARCLYDADSLYIHVRCFEPLVDKLVANTTMRDGVVWEDDCVEVFVDPTHDHEHYFQFVVNSIGTRFDCRDKQHGWNGEWRAAARVGEGGWSVELAFPFAMLDAAKPAAGQVFGLNVCRERYAGGKALSHWSPVERSFHDCPLFGHLVFAAAAELVPAGDWMSQAAHDARPVELCTARGRFRCDSRRSILASGFDASLERTGQTMEKLAAMIAKVRDAKLHERFSALGGEFGALRTRFTALQEVAPLDYVEIRRALSRQHELAHELIWDVKFATLFGD